MASRADYATIEDVISAIELIYENDTREIINSEVYGIYNALKLISFGCIRNTDYVLVRAYHHEIMSYITAYLYTPKRLIINNLPSTQERKLDLWKDIKSLLSGYSCTEPLLTEAEKSFEEGETEHLNVAFVGVCKPFVPSIEMTPGRFYMEVGDEFVLFEKQLRSVNSRIAEDGILIMLCRPGWILKLWQLLDEMKLMLEYKDYRLYVDNSRDANTLVWLRFVKKINDFSIELNKSNVISLMQDNNIDRLFAHKNNLTYPYVELSEPRQEPFIGLNENSEYMQYFFTAKTTFELSTLCDCYTACLVTPSVAQCAHKEGKKVVLFERDNRFRENGGLKYVKYDLYKGLTRLLYNRYLHKFDRVICDPPFNIKLPVLAKDIVELLKPDKQSSAYIIFPGKELPNLISAMKKEGMYYIEEVNRITIEYAKPPKIVRIHGKDAIQAYRFSFQSQHTS